REPDPYGSSHRLLRDSLEVEDVFGWYPPLHSRGPVYYFLAQAPAQGIELVTRLVNFATDRWAHGATLEDGTIPGVRVELPDGVKTWVGDARVFTWYRGEPGAPAAVVVGMMALEKWLYDQQDQKKDVSDV